MFYEIERRLNWIRVEISRTDFKITFKIFQKINFCKMIPKQFETPNLKVNFQKLEYSSFEGNFF